MYSHLKLSTPTRNARQIFRRARIDFAGVGADALADAYSLVPAWLPDGHAVGREWVALNPTRNDRSLGSFKVNLDNGMWIDFATGDSGGDLISLFAYVRGLSQGEAAREVCAMVRS